MHIHDKRRPLSRSGEELKGFAKVGLIFDEGQTVIGEKEIEPLQYIENLKGDSVIWPAVL